MAVGFVAKVLRSYRLGHRPVLLLQDGYKGDISAGDWVEIMLPKGKRVPLPVETVAWGSAFQANDPPLSLVLGAFDGDLPAPDSPIKGVEIP